MDYSIEQAFKALEDVQELGDFEPKKKYLKEAYEGNFRGAKDVKFIWRGETNNPLLEYKGHLFNYWEIEDAMWADFKELMIDKGEKVDEDDDTEFNKYVQGHVNDYLDELLATSENPDKEYPLYTESLKESKEVKKLKEDVEVTSNGTTVKADETKVEVTDDKGTKVEVSKIDGEVKVDTQGTEVKVDNKDNAPVTTTNVQADAEPVVIDGNKEIPTEVNDATILDAEPVKEEPKEEPGKFDNDGVKEESCDKKKLDEGTSNFATQKDFDLWAIGENWTTADLYPVDEEVPFEKLGIKNIQQKFSDDMKNLEDDLSEEEIRDAARKWLANNYLGVDEDEFSNYIQDFKCERVKDKDAVHIYNVVATEQMVEFEAENDIENAKYAIDRLNEDLKFFEIDLEDGYYQGVQTTVKAKYHNDAFNNPVDAAIAGREDDLMYDGLEDEEKAHVQAANEVAEEVKYINDVLLPKLKGDGFHKYGVAYKFSNGETGYTKIESKDKVCEKCGKNPCECKEGKEDLKESIDKTHIVNVFKDLIDIDDYDRLDSNELGGGYKHYRDIIFDSDKLSDEEKDYVNGDGWDEIMNLAFSKNEDKDLKEAPTFDLAPEHDSRKSFYGKAKVDVRPDGKQVLYSYGTPVASIDKEGNVKLHRYGYHSWEESPTTLRHVRDFLYQNKKQIGSKKELAKLYGDTVEFNESLNRSICEEFKLIADLGDYKPWSGAKHTWKVIEENNAYSKLESYLEDIYPEGITMTQLNDILWFDGEQVLNDIGLGEYPKDVHVKVTNIIWDDADISSAKEDGDTLPTEMELDLTLEERDEEDNLKEKVQQAIVDELGTWAQPDDFEFTSDLDESKKLKENRFETSTYESTLDEYDYLRLHQPEKLEKAIKDAGFDDVKTIEDVEKLSAEGKDEEFFEVISTALGSIKESKEPLDEKKVELSSDDYMDIESALSELDENPSIDDVMEVLVSNHPEWKKKRAYVKQYFDEYDMGNAAYPDELVDESKKEDDKKDKKKEEPKVKAKGMTAKEIDDAQISGVLPEGKEVEKFIEKESIKMAEELENNSFLAEHIYPHTWVSGSSTTVYPITCYRDSIIIQLKEDKNIFGNFIKKFVKDHKDIIDYGYFNKSDGSCPSTIEFKFKDRQNIRINESKQLKEAEEINVAKDDAAEKAKEVLDSEDDSKTKEKIVDLDAKTADELKDSYVGKAILACKACHTPIFKDINDLKKSEDEGDVDVYNKDEECTHCGAKEGYLIKGQVAAYDVATDEEGETLDADKDNEINPDEVVNGEAPEESTDEPKEKEEKKELPPLEKRESKEMKTNKPSLTEALDEINETRLDRTIGKFLHETYNNVKEYKTTKIKMIDENLLIEGTITFKSGKTKTSRFMFEKYNMNAKQTKIRFVGKNEAFSKADKTFALYGSIKDKNLVCECLKYNYKVTNESKEQEVKGKINLTENMKKHVTRHAKSKRVTTNTKK